MQTQFPFSRRVAIKSSVLGMIAASLPNIIYSKNIFETVDVDKIFYRYPSIDDKLVSEVVGASHFNLVRVKELVDIRPELARATWDWAFGDWETALGAASHVGRRDIATYLISKGARPDIFTYAMLGHFETVKAMITSIPGVETIGGPHGISLLSHVKAGSNSDDLTEIQKQEYSKLIEYLDSLGTADGKVLNMEMTEDAKKKYLGDYKYGDDPNQGVSIKLNMRKLISLGKLGSFGGALYKKGENVFSYNGTSSVEISFEEVNEKIISLTIHEPNLVLKAIKV